MRTGEWNTVKIHPGRSFGGTIIHSLHDGRVYFIRKGVPVTIPGRNGRIT